MSKNTEVSFIGSGNLAWHLAPALDNTDYPVREVFSRNSQHAAALVKRLYDAKVKTTLDFSSSLSKIFVLAVQDDVIATVASQVILPEGAVLLHTSGSQPLSKLAHAQTPRTGVFYPLQTFTKSRKIDFDQVPMFVESDDRETARTILKMANAISRQVFTISSEQRKALHIAAVFASNFTNHMLTIAGEITRDHKLDFKWLGPVIVETINKALAMGPEVAQTGPAKRGDLEILDNHVAFLEHD